jgi:hypothetical protein
MNTSGTEIKRYKTVVSNADIATMHQIEKFILDYTGDYLLLDIEQKFPGASYRSFFLALHRARQVEPVELND